MSQKTKYKKFHVDAVRPGKLLVIGIGDGRVLSYDDGAVEEIARRPSPVTALCVHDNGLYDGTNEGIIYQTMQSSAVARRNKRIATLCVFREELLDAGMYGVGDSKFGIIKTLESRLLERTGEPVHSLCSFDDGLYVAHFKGSIVRLAHKHLNSYKSSSVADRYLIPILCGHSGELYDSSTSLRNKGSVIQMTERIPEHSGGPVAQRPTLIRALCSHNGVLYDGGKYGLVETLTGKVLVSGEEVTSMCSVPYDLVKGEKNESRK